ncbi:MAG: methionyl-tRNA formyltransferase [Ornithinimicrobium sp.]
MRVLFAGTPEAALPSLSALLDSHHEVVAVLTRPDAPAGRRRVLQPSPVKSLAEQSGVEVLTPTSTSDRGLRDRLVELRLGAAPVVAYGALIPPSLLGVPQHGWVNLHFSLLPAWRGAAPVQRAIMAGDEIAGASSFVLDEGLDTGALLGTLTERVRDDDTSGQLLTRLSYAGAELLLGSLDALESGTAHPQPQSGDGISHAPKLTRDDARVRWDRPAFAVDRQIRGCTPAPGAFTTLHGERLNLGPVTVVKEDLDIDTLAPGQVHVRRHDVLVGSGGGVVRLGEVQPPGKKPMGAAAWARGARLQVGDLLGIHG